ncbi:phd finger domain protein [Niveomyces insectorum RCEF 264]|uniref:Transcription factor BYE1 n=1 Tax=Niveomyces insectorum RCEF 264 TaxID=1081102 RepID=A0A167PXY4_9HYPO|nr:phd finger domain protein [Niveomyces insectorum RCEF 264]
MSDPEPRRSVRSTKGQHKSLDQLDQPATAKKRGRKSGKLSDDKDDDTEEEIIRCICGATEQDGDPGEAWIACDRCAAWQHNVCMGMSVFDEDLAKDYFCEQCKPENHKELLERMARGEKPWEERRRAFQEEKATEKKRRGGRKAKPKRNGDVREGSAKPSPVPEIKRESRGVLGLKRKSKTGSEDADSKAQKRRHSSESEDVPVYRPPDDLPHRITELPDTRQPPARGLFKATSEALDSLQKKGSFSGKGEPAVVIAERLAIQIERAVHDAHPSHKEYAAQIRTLRFNLKENHELCSRLLRSSLTPTTIAVLTSDELASKELQQKNAKLRAQAERQSILGGEDSAPRLRRTHKGEELIEKNNSNVVSEDKPSALRRQSVREANDARSPVTEHPRRPVAPLHVTQRPPLTGGGPQTETKRAAFENEFDFKKVLSSVRSPTIFQQRRPSQSQFSSDGPGSDPDVDRLLQGDDDESPPYSPSEESDPDIVWKGNVVMNTVANFQATARHVGGVNLHTTIGLSWKVLVPKKLTVAGRIDEQIATEYLCSLRYSAPTDITVASLSPATDSAKAEFLSLIDYFTLRKRYGVVGEKGVGNVRDTYLVPIPAGTSNHPEFMLNLEDNFIPMSRVAPMLLLVVVYRNEAAVMEKLRGPDWTSQNRVQPPAAGTPTSALGSARSRNMSASAPAFSPTSPQAPAQPLSAPDVQQFANPSSSQPPVLSNVAAQAVAKDGDTVRENAQREGEAIAREVLGPLASCSAAGFLMSQAAKMQKNEWLLVRTVFEQQPQTRDDLQLLKRELERYNEQRVVVAPTRPSQTPVPIPRVPYTAMSPRPAQPTAHDSQTTFSSLV